MRKREKRAIADKVMVHWVENLFLAHAGELGYDDIRGTNCELCREFFCEECPVALFSTICCEGRWRQVFYSIRDQWRAVPATENMVRELELVLDKWLGYA